MDTPTLSPTKRILLLTLATLVALAILSVPPFFQPDDGAVLAEQSYVGSDTYMRMARVQDWWQGGDWYANVSDRSNWPDGETLHWTRPLDMILVALAVPLMPLLGEAKAFYVSGLIVSPLLALLSLLVLFRTTRPLLDARGQAALAILFAIQPLTRNYFMAARPDHHSLILFGFVVAMALLIRHALEPDRHARDTVLAGVAAGFGIWVSVESLATAVFALSGLGAAWLVWGQSRRLEAMRGFLWGTAAAVLLGLIVERPPVEWLGPAEYDRISIVHATLFLSMAVAMEVMWRVRARTSQSVRHRLATAAGAAMAVGAVIALSFPAFFKGPFGAAMDPRLTDLWLNRVEELQGLDRISADTLFIGIQILWPALWLAVWARGALSARSAPSLREAAMLLAAGAVLFLPLTFYQVRWGAYLGLIAVVPWAILLQRVLDWQGGPKLGRDRTPVLRAPAFVGLAIGQIILAGAVLLMFSEDESQTEGFCRWPEAVPVLNALSAEKGRPLVVLTHIHQGPELLYRTDHRVIGTPYHRNTDGILDVFSTLTTTDMMAAKAILTRRGVDVVMLCIDSAEEKQFLKTEGNTLYRRLTNDEAPDWLKKTPLPREVEEFYRFYQFRPGD